MQTNLPPEEELRWLRREIERLRQECETLKSHDFYLLVEAMPQLVWVVSLDGTMTYTNRSWCDYTGTIAQEIPEDQWLRLIHVDDQEMALVRWHIALETGVSAAGGTELRIRNAKTGEYRWFLVRAMPLLDAQNTISKWVGTCTDIDERKRAEEALHRSQREKETRLLQMRWKLKPSLEKLKRTMHTLTEKLREDRVQGGEDTLTQINKQLDCLTQLIDDFLR